MAHYNTNENTEKLVIALISHTCLGGLQEEMYITLLLAQEPQTLSDLCSHLGWASLAYPSPHAFPETGKEAFRSLLDVTFKISPVTRIRRETRGQSWLTAKQSCGLGQVPLLSGLQCPHL